MRGKILGLKREDARRRALDMVTSLLKNKYGELVPIAYRLKDYNGGDDPARAYCASWSYGERTPTSDCIGLILWSSGIDRKQPGYKGLLGEWLNCRSLIADADGAQVYCHPLKPGEKARVGDWLLTKDHCGLIVRPDPDPADGFNHLVVDCSPRHGRSHAVSVGYPWSEACRVLVPSTKIYPSG